MAGRLNAESDPAFFPRILAQPPHHLLLSHAGARSHPSASTQAFWVVQSARMTAEPLPSYAPDYPPIASLWKQTKKQATHNKYGKELTALTGSGEKALAYCATHPDTVRGLFGRYGAESGLELPRAA